MGPKGVPVREAREGLRNLQMPGETIPIRWHYPRNEQGYLGVIRAFNPCF